MLLATTLSLAAAAALVNLWHTTRIIRVRVNDKVVHGDGGNDLLARRMRAHLNFAEHAPVVLILCALVELAGRGGTWLAVTGGAFLLARVAHAIGMDAPRPHPARAIGMMLTLLTEAGMAIVAVLILLGRF